MALSTQTKDTFRICCIGLMVAVAFTANLVSFPFLGSRIHIGNMVCVLCGFFFGPWIGLLTAGFGNLLYDIYTGRGLECLITFVSKGAIALVAAFVAGSAVRKPRITSRSQVRLFLAALAGALAYVVLYMLKTMIFQSILVAHTEGGSFSMVTTVMLSKLPASLINAVFAAIASPILMNALYIPLRRLGVLQKE